MKAEFTGTYGSELTPCIIFFYDNWYVVEGSINVNMVLDSNQIFDGVDVEMVEDIDCFTWSDPINSIDELIKAVEA